MRILSRTVWILSLVSLFTDMASEMLYPIMPVFLKSIGFSVLLIGVLEGVAEAVAGLSKGYFGKLSDNLGRRLPFVQAGYALSAISKPMMAVLAQPVWILLARTVDRLGKGFRTGARDALLSDVSTPATKGRVFGFHRAMDTVGAVIGPALALLYLHFYPAHYKELFLLAFFPGMAAVLATFILKEKRTILSERSSVHFFSFLRYWPDSPPAYRKLVTGLLVFALINSSDLFLLLRAKEAGLQDSQVIIVYIFYNLAYALLAFPMGMLADRIGLKPVFIFGVVLFGLVYGGMAMNTDLILFFVLFFLYACSVACLEGISKAWIVLIADKKDAATAIGTYSAFQSICAMLASTLTGLVWYSFGPAAAFLSSAVVALAVVAYMMTLPRPVLKS